jgi:multimeric flavodoxin WrbA
MGDAAMNATAARRLLALNGSPVRGSSVDLLLGEVCAGAEEAGGVATHVHCAELNVGPCVACGPDATPGWCIFHDDMDPIYEAIAGAHAIVVGSPVYFDAVSAQLKLVIDRCNCVTPLVTVTGGFGFVPKLARTRRAAFVTACSAGQRYDLAERSVRGFLKWVGAKWEATLVWQHGDTVTGSVARDETLMGRARALGRRLIESPALEP